MRNGACRAVALGDHGLGFVFGHLLHILRLIDLVVLEVLLVGVVTHVLEEVVEEEAEDDLDHCEKNQRGEDEVEEEVAVSRSIGVQFVDVVLVENQPNDLQDVVGEIAE